MEAVVWCQGSGAMRLLERVRMNGQLRTRVWALQGHASSIQVPLWGGEHRAQLCRAGCHHSRWGNRPALLRDGWGGVMGGEGRWLEPRPCVNTSSSRRKVPARFLQGKKNWLKEFSSDKCHKNTYAGICKAWNICSQQCFDHVVRLLKWYFHEISEILMAAGFLSVPFFSWSKKANFTGNITWLETHILMVSINQTMFY